MAMLMAFAKLLHAFAPWLAFLFIAHDTMFRVKVGLLVALALSVVMGVAHLHRGIILWVGLVFFSCASVAVVGIEHLWTLKHMGVLANGALAAGSWLTVIVRRPFTLDYAKAHTDPALWDNPVFLRTNTVITSIWAAVFTVNCGLAFLKMNRMVFDDLTIELISYALLIGCACFTVWYPGHAQKISMQKMAAGG
jgi:hypothetical protein